MRQRPVVPIASLLGIAVLLLFSLLVPPEAAAQTAQGATMTVIRGQVALVRQDGSAVQPAPSGSTVFPGDEIRTVGPSGALITFFTGTEIEMGADTVLRVEAISRQGERIDVSLTQVFGTALHKVATFSDPGSSYRVEAGGAVALVRGTTFLIGYYPPVYILIVVEGQVICVNDGSPQPTPTPTRGADPATRSFVPAVVLAPGQPLKPGGYASTTEPPSCTLEQVEADLQQVWNAAATIHTDKTKQQEEEEQQQEEDSGPTIYSIRGATPLSAEVLRTRLEGDLAPFTAAGSLCALGMIGWTYYGGRRREE
jgi:hypothetical protein